MSKLGKMQNSMHFYRVKVKWYSIKMKKGQTFWPPVVVRPLFEKQRNKDLWWGTGNTHYKYLNAIIRNTSVTNPSQKSHLHQIITNKGVHGVLCPAVDVWLINPEHVQMRCLVMAVLHVNEHKSWDVATDFFTLLFCLLDRPSTSETLVSALPRVIKSFIVAAAAHFFVVSHWQRRQQGL